MSRRIAVSTWSLIRWFQMRRLDGVSFPEFCAERFGVNQLEYVEDQMRPAHEGGDNPLDAYIDRIAEKARATKIGEAEGRIVCIALRNDFTLSDASERLEHVAHVKRWITRAGRIESPYVRIYLGRYQVNRLEHPMACIEQILPVAENRKVCVAIENWGAPHENPEDIVRIVEHFNSPHLGVCLDLGSTSQERFAHYLETLAPHTVHVHAKSYPDERGIPFPGVDYANCVQALTVAGYDGYWTVEFESTSPFPNQQVEGIVQTIQLLQGGE